DRLDMPAVPREAAIETIYGIWLRSSDAMRALAAAHQATYVHVVQPNQYYSAHHFSDDESRIALSLPAAHAYPQGIRAGYQLLSSRSAELSSRGIVSAIGLVDRIDGPVYVDNCCHFTATGETLLARFVADKILSGRRCDSCT